MHEWEAFCLGLAKFFPGAVIRCLAVRDRWFPLRIFGKRADDVTLLKQHVKMKDAISSIYKHSIFKKKRERKSAALSLSTLMICFH